METRIRISQAGANTPLEEVTPAKCLGQSYKPDEKPKVTGLGYDELRRRSVANRCTEYCQSNGAKGIAQSEVKAKTTVKEMQGKVSKRLKDAGVQK